MNHDRYIVALRAVSLALGRIESIHRSRKAIYDNTTSLDKVWEELKYLPVEEDYPMVGSRTRGAAKCPLGWRKLIVPLLFLRNNPHPLRL